MGEIVMGLAQSHEEWPVGPKEQPPFAKDLGRTCQPGRAMSQAVRIQSRQQHGWWPSPRVHARLLGVKTVLPPAGDHGNRAAAMRKAEADIREALQYAAEDKMGDGHRRFMRITYEVFEVKFA